MVLLKVITVTMALNMPLVGNDGKVLTTEYIPYSTMKKCEEKSKSIEGFRKILEEERKMFIYSTECIEEGEWEDIPL